MGVKRWLPRSILPAIALVSLTAVTACGSGSSTSSSRANANGATKTAKAFTSVTIGDPGKSATLWPIYVGQAEGFFKNAGLNVTVVPTQSSAGVPQEMIAGAVDIGSAGIVDFIRAINAGAPLHMFAAGVNEPIYGIIAKKGLSTWSQLAGQRVIVGGPQDITKYYFDAAATANGLSPTKVNFVYAGATSARYAALVGGSVAAAILASPFDAKAEQSGDVNLGNVSKYLPDSPFTAMGVDNGWAKAHATALRNFTAALAQSMAWVDDAKNESAAEDLLVQQTGTTPSAAKTSYQSLVSSLHVFPANAALSASALGSLLQGLVQANFLPKGTSTDPQHYISSSGSGS